MKNLFCVLLLASAVVMSVTGCSSDDDTGNNPDGSEIALLYGKWQSVYLWGEVNGEVRIDREASPTEFIMIFNSGGTHVTFLDNENAQGGWAYDPASRRLYVGGVGAFTVTKLTTNALVVEMFYNNDDGEPVHMVVTFKKDSFSAMTHLSAPSAGVLPFFIKCY